MASERLFLSLSRFFTPYQPDHKFQLDDYGKDFMNRCDVSVYIVPFDSLILTLWFFILGLTQKLPTSLNLSNRQDEAVRWAALPT
ncbi:MAG: hypothetical protein V7K35_08955 [Nostoc sp.]